jgi:hypothetical protein
MVSEERKWILADLLKGEVLTQSWFQCERNKTLDISLKLITDKVIAVLNYVTMKTCGGVDVEISIEFNISSIFRKKIKKIVETPDPVPNVIKNSPSRRSRFDPRSDDVEFMVDEVALERLAPSTSVSPANSYPTSCSPLINYSIFGRQIVSILTESLSNRLKRSIQWLYI